MWFRNVVQLLYGIPGILLYFLAFRALYARRSAISRSFIGIYVITAVSNMATWLNTWVFLKSTNEPYFFYYYAWISDKPLLLNIHSFLISHFYYVQNVNLLLLTFDRFSEILCLGNEGTKWKKYFIFIAIIAHALSLGGNLAIRLPMVTQMFFDTVNARFVAVQTDADNDHNAISNIVQLGFGVFTFIVCLIFNAVSLKLLHKLKLLKSTTTEKHHFVFSVCIFVAQFLNLIIVALIVALQQWKEFLGLELHTVFEFAFFTSDLLSLGPAFFLILLPGPVRTFVVERFHHTLYLFCTAVDAADEPIELEVYRNQQEAINQYDS